MSRFPKFIASAVLFAALFSSAAAGPRAAPPNDNFVSAQPIEFGKTYKVKKIESATIDAGQPSFVCGANAFYYSVWYTFTLPVNARVYFSTDGTRLVSEDYVTNGTQIAVLTGTPGAFTVEQCPTDPGLSLSELVFAAQKDTTYYLIAGAHQNLALDSSSVFKLRTRVQSVLFDNNGNFGVPTNGADWKIKNASNDTRVCGNASYPGWNDSCAFRLVGNAEENSTLSQTITFPAGLLPRKDAALVAGLFYRILDAPTLGKAKIVVTFVYTDGALASKSTIDLTGRPAGMYQYVRPMMILKSSALGKIKVAVKFKSTTGVLLIDEVGYNYEASASVREMSVLPPLPPPAD